MFWHGILKGLCLFLAATCLSSCERAQPQVSIAINPWPGYAFLHLAKEKGFFEEAGLDVKLVEVDSLSDAMLAYIHGRVDGMASTVVESVHANYVGSRPLSVILFSDYSDGADVVVASQGIASIKDLKGKRVGCEIGSLGDFILYKALSINGLKYEDVEVVNIEPSAAMAAMQSGEIDAYVTYPPVSQSLIKSLPVKIVFSSSDIPYEVLDTISVDRVVLERIPDFKRRFSSVWEKTLEYYQDEEPVAAAIMARHLNMDVTDLYEAYAGLHVLGEEENETLFADQVALTKLVDQECMAINHSQANPLNCVSQTAMFSSME